MRWNIRKLKEYGRFLSQQIHTLKTQLRPVWVAAPVGQVEEGAAKDAEGKKKMVRERPGRPMTCNEGQGLNLLRELATRICCIRAHSRGRLHMPKKMTLKQQAQFIAPYVSEFLLPERKKKAKRPVRAEMKEEAVPAAVAQEAVKEVPPAAEANLPAAVR